MIDEYFLCNYVMESINIDLLYPLCSAFWIALGTTNPENVRSSAISSEKASVIETVRVNTAVEAFRCLQSEFHSVLTALLTHCNI